MVYGNYRSYMVACRCLYCSLGTPLYTNWTVESLLDSSRELWHFGNSNNEPDIALDCFERKKLLWEIGTFSLMLLIWYWIILLYTQFVVTIVPYFRHLNCEHILCCECYLQMTCSNVSHSQPISGSLPLLSTNQRLFCLLSQSGGLFLLSAFRKLQVKWNVFPKVVDYFKRTASNQCQSLEMNTPALQEHLRTAKRVSSIFHPKLAFYSSLNS